MPALSLAKIASLAALAGALAIPASSVAQNAADPFGLPADVEIMANNDPNVRVATAIVNGDVITGTDVDQRVALVTSASQNEVSGEELIRLRQQVLRNLIDETLQIQEAKAQELPVERADVERSCARLAAQNFGQDPSAMDTYLRSVGSSPASLKRQIEGELAWQRLLGRNVSPFVNVAEEEVNEVLKRLEASRGTEEFRLGEIYLSATPESDAAVTQNANRIVEQLRQGGSFVAYARQFSEASTAAVGGDLGWVRPAQLPAELATAAAQMQPGQLVGPLAIPGGYSILLLIDRRQVLTADPRDAVLSLKQISIGFPEGATQETANERARTFAEGVQTMRGCGDVETVAERIGATVVTNDEIRARALPEQLQAAILSLQIGQSTPPFGSVEDGIRVLMLCGRDDPEVASGPNFETLMDQMTEERVNKRAQRYLRDLRNDAYITYN